MTKRLLVSIAAVLLAAPSFATSVVLADSEVPIGQNTTQSTEEKPDAPETAEDKAAREARVKQLKESLKIKLNAATKKRIQDKCKASQGTVSSVAGRAKGIETSRAQVHAHVIEHLNELVAKLQAAGVNTTELETAISELKTKIATFDASLAAYKQSLTDLTAIDCKTDPEGFQAALQTARTNLEKVRTDARAVHTYLKETIKPLLASLRSQLEKPAGTDAGTGGTQ